MAEPIRIGIRRPQALVLLAGRTKRFRVLNAGRRFGKTHLAAVELFQRATNKNNSINWYVAPTYRQAEQIAWAKLKLIVPQSYIRSKNETDLRIELRNGSIIALRGADNPDSLRGVGLDFVVLDECCMMDVDVWQQVLRPALSDKQGDALFISTPKGYNWFYDLYQKASDDEAWGRFQFTTAQGGNVDLKEIESAKADMDERIFKQEYLASFELLAGRIYYAFDRDHNVTELTDDPQLPVLVGMDFNVDPMTAVIGIRRADQIHIIDEIKLRNGNTELMSWELKRRFPDRAIRVYPDPTGNARKTSAAVGQTDFTILRSHGFQVLAPSGPYATADKTNTVNAALCSASGNRRVFIKRDKCPELKKSLDGYCYKDGGNEPDKKSGLDHISDAFAYLVCYEIPMRGKASIVQLEAS